MFKAQLLPFTLAVGLAAPLSAQTITYTLSGGIGVDAAENAASSMIIDVSGQITITPDGEIAGQGQMIYLAMAPCEWVPPHLEAGQPPYCQLTAVTDGAFAITGHVLELIHRRDEDHPWRDAVFAFADEYADGRLDYAPARIELQLYPQSMPAEHMLLWGFSNFGVEARTTEAATLGLYVSGLFDQPIELVAIPAGVETPGLNGANRAYFEGVFDGGTPVAAAGGIALADFPYDMLNHATDPAVLLATLPDRPWTDAEQAALDDYRENGYQQDSREGRWDEIFEIMWDLGERRHTSSSAGFGAHLDAVMEHYSDRDFEFSDLRGPEW